MCGVETSVQLTVAVRGAPAPPLFTTGAVTPVYKETVRYNMSFHLHEQVKSRAQLRRKKLSRDGPDAATYGRIAADLRTLESMALGLQKKACQEAGKDAGGSGS